jgi:hypothetical protein
VLLSACSNTTFVKSWKAPDAEAITPDSFKKVMVAVLVKDETTRRYAEDRMAKNNSAFHPSYNIFTSKELMSNTEYCQKLLAEQGFDGIISMQLVNVEESVHYVPGTYTGGYWGYYGYSYPGYYNPGYYESDTKFIITTNIFSLKENKLLWSGVTSTVDPTSIDQTLAEITDLVKKQMIKDKLLIP